MKAEKNTPQQATTVKEPFAATATEKPEKPAEKTVEQTGKAGAQGLAKQLDGAGNGPWSVVTLARCPGNRDVRISAGGEAKTWQDVANVLHDAHQAALQKVNEGEQL